MLLKCRRRHSQCTGGNGRIDYFNITSSWEIQSPHTNNVTVQHSTNYIILTALQFNHRDIFLQITLEYYFRGVIYFLLYSLLNTQLKVLAFGSLLSSVLVRNYNNIVLYINLIMQAYYDISSYKIKKYNSTILNHPCPVIPQLLL